MSSAGHPSAVDGTKTSSDDADVTDCSDAALVISRPALATIRRLGTTAWVVLEVLTLEAVADDGALVARTSARSIAEAVSVSKDTAAGALRRLADARLVERRPQYRTGGRFGSGGYVLHLPAGLATAVRRTDETPPVLAPADRARPRPTRPPRPERHDQLTLLDPPPGPTAMNPTSPVPIRTSPTANASLSPPATTTHEFASSDASVSRDPFRDVPDGWPSC